MTDTSSLLAHCGTERVTRAQLAALPEPAVMGPRHRPVPHIDLVESIERHAAVRGLDITREEFSLSRDGGNVFGIIKFATGPDGESAFSLGLRSSNKQELAIRIVAGLRVFCCDNLILAGDMLALSRKHTTGIDLNAEVSAGLDRYMAQSDRLVAQTERLKGEDLFDDSAKVWIVDAFRAGIAPVRLFPAVVANYFDATDETPDCQPRSLWGLNNSFTRAFHDLRPAPRFRSTVALGRLFGLN